MYTTYDGLSSSDKILELNPLLGDRPSLSQLIGFKLIANYLVDPHYINEVDPQLLEDLNRVLGIVVLNNRHVKNKTK